MFFSDNYLIVIVAFFNGIPDKAEDIFFIFMILYTIGWSLIVVPV